MKPMPTWILFQFGILSSLFSFSMSNISPINAILQLGFCKFIIEVFLPS